MSDQRITDLSYLEDIGMGDDALLIEMIELFLKNTPESLKLLKEYEAEKEWKRISAEAHKLKPNLSYMGLEGARELVIEIETSIKKEKNLEEVRPKILEIERTCKKAYSELTERLDNLKG